ncbi:ester cyclase [Micromonospora sp. DT47]|uniref:ester cyclase n=1 Tax=Micromonospora sp. DT47 TaxID=3393431 RepID=UPI003CE74D3E
MNSALQLPLLPPPTHGPAEMRRSVRGRGSISLAREDEVTIARTPDDYAGHVREMIATWGEFELTVDDFLVEGARAYVRLTQVGRHLAPVDGLAPTGHAVWQINSIVYHVADGPIAEYWMQIDRAGLRAQLCAAT